jgi:hypothetical protein
VDDERAVARVDGDTRMRSPSRHAPARAAVWSTPVTGW